MAVNSPIWKMVPPITNIVRSKEIDVRPTVVDFLLHLASTILSIDLSQNWTNSTIVIQSTIKPDAASSLNNPSLWFDEHEGLLYSGFTGWTSPFGDDPSLPPLSMWTFKPDGSGSGIWNQVIDPGSTVWLSVSRPSSALMAYGLGTAWALGGYTSPGGYYSTPQLEPQTGMVQFDMGTRSFTNLSAGGYSASGIVERGAMHFVSSFGSQGLYVVMGGATTEDHAGLIDFGTVSIFDPAKEEWWNQTTTGRKPAARIEFCAAGISSTNGTYEM